MFLALLPHLFIATHANRFHRHASGLITATPLGRPQQLLCAHPCVAELELQG